MYCVLPDENIQLLLAKCWIERTGEATNDSILCYYWQDTIERRYPMIAFLHWRASLVKDFSCSTHACWNMMKNFIWNSRTLAKAVTVPDILRVLHCCWGSSEARGSHEGLSVCETFSNVVASPCGCPQTPVSLSPWFGFAGGWIEMCSRIQAGALRTQWWTVFICWRTSWLPRNDVNYIRYFIRMGQTLSRSLQIYDVHVWMCGCDSSKAGSV